MGTSSKERKRASRRRGGAVLRKEENESTQLRRKEESDQQRQQRLTQQQQYEVERRREESDQQRQQRLTQQQQYEVERRREESDQQRQQRLTQQQQYDVERRREESDQQRQQRLTQQQQYDVERRREESEQQRQQRLTQQQQYNVERRREESDQQRQQRLTQQQQYEVERRREESDQQRQQRLAQQQQYNVETRRGESDQQRQQRLAQQRQANYARREEQRMRTNAVDWDITAEELDFHLKREGETFFDDFPESLVKAILLFYVNSGLFRFEQWKDYSSKWDEKDIDVDKLRKEIEEEMMSDKELMEMLKKFFMCHSYTDDKLVSCGACGLREMERPEDPEVKYHRLNLDSSSQAGIFKYSEEDGKNYLNALYHHLNTVYIPIDTDWHMKSVCVLKAKSVYVQEKEDGSRTCWYLHPELIQKDEGNNGGLFTMLCPYCHEKSEKGKTPRLSIANGVDLGCFHRLGLTYPNLQEQLIIARNRLYYAAMKICSNTTGASCNKDYRSIARCNAILFPHDAPEVATYMYNPDIFATNGVLDPGVMKQLMTIFFVDDKGKIDQLATEVFGSHNILGRDYVVAQWLIVLKHLNVHYADIDMSGMSSFAMKALFHDLHQSMKENKVDVDDEDAVQFEKFLGSDVSHNQHQEIFSDAERAAREEVAAFPSDGSLHIRYSMITRTEESYLALDKNDFRLIALEKFARIDGWKAGDKLGGLFQHIDDESEDFVSQFPSQLSNLSRRQMDPLNDFTKDDKGLATSFPHIFMLGKAYGTSIAGLSSAQRYHLLHQFHLVPAQDRRLLGFLVDVMQRMKVMRSVKSCVEGSRYAIETIQNLLQNQQERKLLLEAIRFPYTPGAKALKEKYLSVLRFAGKNVSYGAVEGRRLSHLFVGTTNRYSAPTCFLTISAENLSNVRSIRMSFRTLDNESFPADFDEKFPCGRTGKEFIDYMVTNGRVISEGEVLLPPGMVFNKAGRSKLASDNPIAFVQENKILLNDILSILLGLPIDGKEYYSRTEGSYRRRTRYFKNRKGLFGYALSLTGVTEDHAKGHLHWHLTCTAGLSAKVLQRFANLASVCQSISKVLDSMYVSKVKPEVCATTIVRNYAWKKRKHGEISISVQESLNPVEPLFLRPDPLRIVQEQQESQMEGDTSLCELVIDLAQLQAGDQEFHRHQHGCHDRKWGLSGCRFSMPRATRDGTGSVILKPILTTGNNTQDAVGGNDNSGTLTLEEILLFPPRKIARTVEPQDSSEPEPWFSSTPLMGNVTGVEESDLDNNHHLTDLLDNTLAKKVVVWETDRPPFDLPVFLQEESHGPQTRQLFIERLQEYLKVIPPLNDSHIAFWKWLKEDATDVQVKELRENLREQLPVANGYIATFNPVISFCTGSHNNAWLLGSLGQAKGAMFYLIPYQGKSKFDFQQSLTILNKALHHVDTHESQAADSGTVQRSAKQFLTRALNRMHLQMEMSDYQVAAALLELPSMITTDRFCYGNPSALAAMETKLKMEEEEIDRRDALFERIALAQQRRNATFAGPLHPVPDVNDWLDDDEDSDDGEERSAHDPYMSIRVEDALEDYGRIQKVKLRGGRPKNQEQDPHDPDRDIVIPEVALYRFCGQTLKKLSYYEYLACIKFENEPMPKIRKGGTALQFQLDPEFQGFPDCRHAIRTKQHTPLLTGKKPRHPGKEPPPNNVVARNSWIQKANKYARYYLTLFCPGDMATSIDFTWNGLQKFIVSLEDDDKIISKFRLIIMHQHMEGLRVSEVCKKMVQDFISRCRTVWNSKQQSEEIAYQMLLNRTRLSSDLRAQDLLEVITGRLKPRSEKEVLLHLRHDAEQRSIHNSLFPAQYPGAHRLGVSTRLFSKVPFHRLIEQSCDIHSWKKTHKQVGEEDTPFHPINATPSPSLHKERTKMLLKIRHSLRKNDGSNSQQLELFDMYASYFLDPDTPSETMPPSIALIHGPPGVGKSKLRDAIAEASRICGRFNMKTAFNSINATEMGGHTTAHLVRLRSEVHMVRLGDIKADVIKELQDDGFDTSSIVFIEECSTEAPWHIARLCFLCQVANGELDRSFGGCLALLLGDLTQLGPVKAGNSITQAVMDVYADDTVRKWMAKTKPKKKKDTTILPFDHNEDNRYKADHPYTIGTNLMISVRWYEMLQQQRCIEDPEHTKMVNGTYRGMPISLMDLKRRLKILSSEDCKKKEWIEASVLTATNRQRFSLTHDRAIQFARYHKTVVLRWLKDMKDDWTPAPEPQYKAEAMQDPCFYEYFVEGCDGFVSECVSRDLHIVNALPFKYHSIKFDPQTEKFLQERLNNATPGDFITVPQRPLCVNIELFMPDNTPNSVKRALKRLSIRDTSSITPISNPIIPITEQQCTWDSNQTPVYGGTHFPSSKITLRHYFPLEPALAITVHKAQGRTLKRVIIALSYCDAKGCNFSYRQVHVALSRVRNSDHIRLLLTGESEAMQWMSLLYIDNLRPDPSIRFYFAGFRDCSIDNPNLNWLSNEWNARRANTVFKREMGLKDDQ